MAIEAIFSPDMRTILASQTVTIPDNGKPESLLYNSIDSLVVHFSVAVSCMSPERVRRLFIV